MLNLDPRIAFLAPVVMLWGTLKGWFLRFTFLFVRRVRTDNKTLAASEAWLRRNARRVPLGPAHWIHHRLWAGDRHLNYVFDAGQMDGILFLYKWHLVKLDRSSNTLVHSPFFDPSITLAEMGWADGKLGGDPAAIPDRSIGTGFRTQWIKGSAGQRAGSGPKRSPGGGAELPPPGIEADPESGLLGTLGSFSLPFWDLVPVLWGDKSKLGADSRADAVSREHILTPELGKMAGEFRTWALRKEWCRERRIPWRRGVVLQGKPGGGKSTFVRYLGMRFQVPIFQFDLASMTNEDLEQSENNLADGSVKILLFEDIDAIWQGRECKLEATDGHRPVTFDRFLQFLGGITDRSGWFVVITTNHPESLDPALVRQGRIESMVEVGPISKDLQRRLAERILKGYPDKIEEVLAGLPEQEMINVVEAKMVRMAEEIFQSEIEEATRGVVVAVAG